MRHTFLILVSILLACRAHAHSPSVQPGDVIFHTSRSSQSLAIQRATSSPYSHMGLVLFKGGKPYVLEAVSSVRYTPLQQWIERGTGHHYVVKRLVNSSALLGPTAIARVTAEAQRLLGQRYDLTFEWSDERLYCSELVWKIFKRALGLEVGSLQRVRDFNLTDPTVRAKMRERYGDHIPLDEPVISPVAMFNSPRLITVAER